MIDNYNTQEGHEFGWDDTIEKDSPDFILLPDGDYDFEVTAFERARHNGSDKLPPCAKAVVHIKIEIPEGVNIIRHQLFLHSITEGMLCAFFMGIGQRKKGEKLKMNWNQVVGSKGRAKIGTRNFVNDKGDLKNFNEIKKFYEPPEQQTIKGFTPGSF
ncbi:MAG: DUF669 domain-containing protein [Eubacterium sp.]